MTRRYFNQKKSIIYETDYGYVFQNKQTNEIQQHDKFEIEDLALIQPGDSLVRVATMMSPKSGLYFRNYVKIQEIIANIGGVIKGILLISAIFVKLISRRIYSFLNSHLN